MEKKDIENIHIRVPVNKIVFQDPYEQSKYERLLITDPQIAISYLEEIFNDSGISISFEKII
uniref:hypothetical protein n=1 Tax=Clostridium sp. NkU-1 TaxID=1095009 RepID=UPI0006D1B728